MREMVIKGKHHIAEEYLKKTLLQFSGNFFLLAELLLKYSKIVKSYYPSIKVEHPLTFMFDTIKKASVAVPDDLYANLFLYI